MNGVVRKQKGEELREIPETHTKRQATQHGFPAQLPSLMGDIGTKELK